MNNPALDEDRIDTAQVDLLRQVRPDDKLFPMLEMCRQQASDYFASSLDQSINIQERAENLHKLAGASSMLGLKALADEARSTQKLLTEMDATEQGHAINQLRDNLTGDLQRLRHYIVQCNQET